MFNERVQDYLDAEVSVKQEELIPVKTTLLFKVTRQINGEIEFNYQEFKSGLAAKLNEYHNYAVTSSTLVTAKSDLAMLRKVRGAIEDEGRRVKKDILKQYDSVFMPQCKELVSMTDDVITSIDNQVKGIEKAEENIKRKQVEDYFDLKGCEIIALSQIWDDRWLNKTYSLSKVQSDIDNKILEVKQSLEVIEGTITNENDCLEVKAEYLKTLNLASAISSWKEREALKKRISQSTPQEVKQAPIPVADEPIYKIAFEVVGTESSINKLSQWLKSNGYNYKQINQ